MVYSYLNVAPILLNVTMQCRGFSIKGDRLPYITFLYLYCKPYKFNHFFSKYSKNI